MQKLRSQIGLRATLFAGFVATAGIFVAYADTKNKFRSTEELISLSSTRQLRADERQRMVKLIEIAINKVDYPIDTREKAIEKLGKQIGHKEVIPAMLAIVRDHGEDDQIRIAALYGMCWINHPNAAYFLVEVLESKNSKLRFHADQLTTKLITVGPKIDKKLKPEVRVRQWVTKWKVWWKENRSKVQLSRESMLIVN